MSTARPLHLTVHLVGAATGVHPGAWRWPAVDPLTFASIDRWVEAAQVAERGLLDAVFLSDVPALWGDITDHPQAAYFLEPTITLTAIARATTHIGLIGTASTTFNEPYNIARRFKSLDLVSHGRTGWNAVTTFVPIVAGNFGGTEIAGRQDRYARANEFTDVVRALWESWQPGALIADVGAGHFADHGSLTPIDHHGTHFSVTGPLPIPPSEQGHPVIFQAGASEPGRDLAARTADAVFSGAITLDDALAYAGDIRARAAGFGRDPASIAVLPGLMTSIGGTEEEAAKRLDELDDLAYRDGALTTLAEKLHLDPDRLDPDSPIPVQWLPPLDGEGVVHVLDTGMLRLAHEGLTVRAILRSRWRSGHLAAAGTPEQVADVIEHWHGARAADGFTLMPDVIADGLPAFVDHVVPLLQQRGLSPPATAWAVSAGLPREHAARAPRTPASRLSERQSRSRLCHGPRPVTVLSVLDQGPVGATTGPAAVLKAAGALARHVEDLGYARFWVAEYHATPSIGISAPEIVIGHLASLTSTLRIGAGGMLLANHSPLHVVEQFRTLESLYPGRIDLGIGRSHGTNLEPTIAALARSSLDAAAFSAQLTQLLTLGRADRQPGSQAPIIPENVCLPPVFLLGASESSARAAAELGLGYAFLAAYQDPANAVRALRTYRNTFTTIHPTAEPHAILTLTVVVGTDDHHAEELAAPWRLALAQHALGRGRRLRTVRELQQYTPTHEEIAVQSRPPLSDRRSEIVGGPARVADLLHDLVGASRADEVLAVTNIPDPVERHRSYERLAIAMAR